MKIFLAAFLILFISCNNDSKTKNQDVGAKGISDTAIDTVSYSFIVKLDVKDLVKSTEWYTNNFGLVENKKYSTSEWAQFSIPGVRNAELGLKLRPGSSSGGVNLTFIVPNIKTFRNKLISNGVNVDTIKDVGKGVYLAFLRDLDSNRLVLRQEGK